MARGDKTGQYLKLVMLVVLVLVSAGSVQAADVGGEFVGGLRVMVKEDEPLENAFASLAIETDIEGELGETGDWRLALDISLDKALNMFRDDIWDADDTDAAEDSIALELKEAFINLYSVGEEPLDLRIGKQQVDLGVGDGITTFNLTKPVAANFIDEMQSTRAVTGLRADYYTDEVDISAFFQPRVTPTKVGERIGAVYGKAEQAALQPMIEQMSLQGMVFGGLRVIDESPSYDENGMGLSLRASRFVAGYDLGVVYQKGYASTPMIRGFELEPVDGSPPNVRRMVLTKGYLPLQKVGLTAEGTWGDAGIWGELTYNIPKDGFFSPGMDAPTVPEEYRQNSEKYVTGLVGMDYFMANGAYVNGQIIHGFPQEVTKNTLNTYLVGDIYQDFLKGRLRLEAKMVYCFDDQGWMIMPEAVYQLDANKKCFGKLAVPGGADQSLFRQMEDLTQVLIGVSIGF